MTLSTEQQTAVNLAILGTKMTHMENGMTDVKFSNARQTERIEEVLKAIIDINQRLAEQRGGWKAFTVLIGIAGSLGGVMGWLVSNFKG